jgi:hypothetical protein
MPSRSGELEERSRAILRQWLLGVALVVFGATTARAQVRVGRDSSTRLQRFGRDALYGTGLGLVYGVVDQLRHEPPEWGTGWNEYDRRAASDVGEFLIQEGTTEALAAALHRPLDYAACPCGGTGARIRWALLGAVTDPMPNGAHPIAVPRIVGAYVGSFAQTTWLPARSHRTRTGLVNGSVSLAIGAGINLFQEFRHRRR